MLQKPFLQYKNQLLPNQLVLKQFAKCSLLKPRVLQHLHQKQLLKHHNVDIFKTDVAKTNDFSNINFGSVVKHVSLATFQT